MMVVLLLVSALFLLSLAIAPGIAIAIYFYLADKYEKEPLHLVIRSFFLGCVSIAPAILGSMFFSNLGLTLNEFSMSSTFLYAFITVALSEELAKYALVYYGVYRNPEFNEPFDGIVYAVMVSLGFATLENILYSFEYGFGTAILRMFTAVPAHASFGVIMGFFLGVAKFSKRERQNKILGILAATIAHGLYDFFLMQKSYEFMFIGALVSLIISIQLAKKAMKMHINKSPFKPLID